MVRRSMPWSLVLAVLVLVGPCVALACTVAEPKPWTKRTPDGRFELAVTGVQKNDTRDLRLSLKDRRSGAAVWTIPLEEFVSAEDVLLTPDGAATLVIKRRQEKFMLYGGHGDPLASWPLENVLSRSELDRINVAPCLGKQWGRESRWEADGFSLKVPLRAPVGRLPDARSISFRISPLGKMEREPALLLKTPIELIRMYTQETELLGRLRLAEELWGVSREDRSRVPEEVSRFWREVVNDRSTPRSVLPIAVEGLGAAGLDEDLHALRRLLPDMVPERDAHILQVLARRLPEAAGTYAVNVLDRPHPSPLVRAAALEYLLGAGGTATKLGQTLLQHDALLHDVRAVGAMGAELQVLEDFWQVLPFCEHPGARARAAATETLTRLVRSSGHASAVLLDVPPAAERALLSGCPEVLIVLGAVAEKNEEQFLARQLYGFGVDGLELPPEAPPSAKPVILEAKLRGAALAMVAEDWSDLGRLTREVLADPARSTPVCGLSAALYAPEPDPAACARLRPAEAVARKLLQDARAKGVTSRELLPESD